MTDCADSTVLRGHLDHPDAAVDAHLDGCESCPGLLRSVAEDAGFARRALALLDRPDSERTATDADVDVEAALAAVLATATPAPAVPITASRRRGGWSTVGRRLALSGAAAVLALVVVVTPAGRSAVASVLDVFRSERLQVVTVDLAAWAASVDPQDVGPLAALGDLDMDGLSEPAEVADAAEAEEVAGIAAPRLDQAPDHFVALAPGTVRLVLDARDGNGVPAELDEAALVVDVPGAIGAIYGPTDGVPELVVGRSGPLVVRSEGASLEAIRSFILDREELPPDLRAQLADIDDWRRTVPVPVPLDGPGWDEVEVAGRPAIAFGDDSGLGALVLRRDPDGVTVVGGRIGIERALDLAERA
jgi:hypothetical protein